MGEISRIFALFVEAWLRFFRRHGMVYSASISFNILLASLPILFLAFAIAGAVFGRDDLPFSQLSVLLKEVLPTGAHVLVSNLRKMFTSGMTLGAVGTALLVLSSFSATDAVHTSLAVMIGDAKKKLFVRSLLFHAAFVLALTVLAFGAILVPPMFKGFLKLMRGTPVALNRAETAILVQFLSEIFLVIVCFVGGAVSYRYLAPVRIRWRSASIGGGLFVILLVVIGRGYAFYLDKFSQLDLIYGSLFTVVCFIIALYLFAAAYLYCASVIGVLEHLETGEEKAPG